MRRGSLPRGSAHRLYRSRLPNGFSKLGHHRFRSGSMGNGGERRTPKPKNACGSRVCAPVRCVRSSPGRVNRSKHCSSFPMQTRTQFRQARSSSSSRISWSRCSWDALRRKLQPANMRSQLVTRETSQEETSAADSNRQQKNIPACRSRLRYPS